MDKRENFGTRLGFILVSAGCAVGLGNVWKFPYICGQNGGAAFIVLYLICLALLGWPILICEYAVGRASRQYSQGISCAGAEGHAMASVSLVQRGGQLSAHDVLHHGLRLDD